MCMQKKSVELDIVDGHRLAVHERDSQIAVDVPRSVVPCSRSIVLAVQGTVMFTSKVRGTLLLSLIQCREDVA